MACLAELKENIKLLETLFPKSHELFQILSASVDEITVRFIIAHGKVLIIQASMTETYPRNAPIWFAESEDIELSVVLQKLCETPDEDSHILKQTKILITELCQTYELPLPSEVTKIDDYFYNREHLNNSDSSEDEDDENADEEDDFHYEMDEDQIVNKKTKDEYNGIDMSNLLYLEKLKQNQRDDYLKQGSISGSVQATDRLMKELKDIYKSDSYKNGHYCVELVNDSLYEWNIKIMKLDPDSLLYKDLELFKENEGKDNILLNFLYKDTFPFDPPFVRVVTPILSGGYVLCGGAICMELLTTQGWSSAYSLESVIMQIAATLVKGKARIQFGASRSQYSLARAQRSFKSLVHIHEKNGWFTPPKEEG